MANSEDEVNFQFEEPTIPKAKKKTRKKKASTKRKTAKRPTPRIDEFSSGQVQMYQSEGREYFQVKCPGCTHMTVGCLNKVGAQVTLRSHIRTHHLKPRGRG